MKNKPIIKALKEFAKHNGYNQSEMAITLGLTRSHYSEVLNGVRELPKKAMCKAYALGISSDAILDIQNYL